MSNQIYIGYDFIVSPLQPATEILIAELGYVGFDSFVESEKGVTAYIQKDKWNAFILDDINILSSKEFEITFEFNEIEQTNWNEEWEKNFKPVQINSHCLIRSEFHNNSGNFKDEIIITPKMSFGTGHHETTFLMINELYNLDLNDKSILDMGSGTGVLSIVASKNGAKQVVGIDIDEWAYENSIENSLLNNTNNIKFLKGDISLIENKTFDCVLANINRNIILRDLVKYYKLLINGGKLLISGFLVEDFDLVYKKINKIGFKLINKKNKNKWLMLHLEK